jgi:hypothetical protein
MHLDDLAAALRRQPFKPFRLYVSDGAAYEVRHPEMMWLSRRTAYVGVPAESTNLIPEHAVMIDLLHVSRMEELIPASPGNGHS